MESPRIASQREHFDALIATIVYADLFDYALTRDEAHRFLIGLKTSRDDLDQLLADANSSSSPVTCQGPYLTMAGREHLIEIRKRREAEASRLWSYALAYRGLLSRLPFVRMIAITGTLAMNNTEPGGDIDLFIVTAPGRLWLARAFIVGIVRLAARRGITLCPNYLVTERALVVKDKNIFTAHELAQMIPIYGLATYQQMMNLNDWVLAYLPNTIAVADQLNDRFERPAIVKSISEAVLGMPPGTLFERWEMRRKSTRFSRLKQDAGTQGNEADFGPDWCKGHFQGHETRTLHDYDHRLQSLGLNGVKSHAS